MSQKLSAGGFKWVRNKSRFNKDFIKSYNGDNYIGYFLEADVQYPGKLHELHHDLPFLPKRMRIKKKLKNL